jgi:hypothetical protein
MLATYPIDGFPPLPIWLKPIFWVMRITIAKGILQKAITTGQMQEKSATAPQSVVQPNIDPKQALESFRKAVERWNSHTGAFLDSPFFGKMTKEQVTQLHTVHAAHHLSFLLPKS